MQDGKGHGDSIEGFLGWLGTIITEWEWWQVGILLSALTAIVMLPQIIKAYGEFDVERKKVNNRHKENMKKLENSHSTTKRQTATSKTGVQKARSRSTSKSAGGKS